MKKSILCTIAISASAALFAQTPEPVPVPVPPGQITTAPEPVAQNPEYIQFTEVVYDFGNIKQGIPASHIFEFKNVGTRDITLINVGTSCGCTAPNWKGGIYKPQAIAQINATYNASSEGAFNKTLTVLTSEGTFVLTITGNVMNAAAYDEWKIKKDAEDKLKKEQEELEKKTSKKKGKGKEKVNQTADRVKQPKEEPKKAN